MRAKILFVLLFIGFALPSLAQDAGDAALFQVSDVAADVTADSAAHARDQAIMQAQRNAFGQLLTRLGADAALERTLDDDTVAAMVQAFEVQQEKRSSVRYIGTFTVRFKPNAVRGFLNKHGNSFTEVRSKPVLILPIVNNGAHVTLWEDRNAWRTAWDNAVGKGSLVPIAVPAGDMDDIGKLSGKEAIAGKFDALQALMAKYQTESVAVVTLNADMDKPDPQKPVVVDIQRFDINGPTGEAEHLSLSPAANAKAFDPLLADAVKQVRARLESAYRQNAAAPSTTAAHLRVIVPIASLADWNDIKARLGNIPGLDRMNVVALTRAAATVDLDYHVDGPQLMASLGEAGLRLEQNPADRTWFLRSESGQVR